ncbi:MAG: hypothetical protein U0802_11330 [Candidatus Binatia bacterium]
MVFSSGEERRLVMSTKMGIWRGALAAAAVLLAVGTASARVIDPTGVTTNDPAGIVLYPKLKVDPNSCQGRGDTAQKFCTLTDTACTTDADCRPHCVGGTCNFGGPPASCTTDDDCLGTGFDTVVQLTNTAEFLTKVHCFYTNANGHCSNDFSRICTEADFRDVCGRGGLCIPGWQETDFRLTLTKRQPISWSVNKGLPFLPLAGGGGQGNPPQANEGSIPPVLETPFKGELLCVQVDVTTELPTDRNDLKGEASVINTDFANIDDARYDAIGIKAIEGRRSDDGVLNIGGPDAEYGVFSDAGEEPRFVGCPNVITLNHFFEGAEVETHAGLVSGPVRSDLTIVPCARDYLHQTANGSAVTVQFLIYNEFEQRFSTSTSVFCFEHTRLVDIDTRPGPDGDAFSIFSAGVQGTITGMSRLRSVQGPDVDGYDANGILALLSEHWAAGECQGTTAQAGGNKTPYGPLLELCATDADCSVLDGAGQATVSCINPHVQTTAANVQFQGSRRQGDRIIIPLP